MDVPAFLPRDRLSELIRWLAEQGYRVIGPRVHAGVIEYGDIADVTDLPCGWHDVQEPGRYRLERSGSPRCFAWANGPQAIKPFLFAPREPLWRAERRGDGFAVTTLLPRPQPLAFFGVRACDLAALAIHDRHFLGGSYPDPHYAARSEEMLVIAVNCSHPAATCFCASTDDGPRARAGFDLALTELDEGFVAEAGSMEGRAVLEALAAGPATAAQREAAEEELARAARLQARRLPPPARTASLLARLDHPEWEAVAARCLACGNCTQVCPTCFCHGEQDVPLADGSASVHERFWDSCFSAGHGYIHGFQVRPEIRHRYRQWLTHKLAAWQEQFGRSGCVGCGRCISWCPVGIDLTEVASRIVEADTDAV